MTRAFFLRAVFPLLAFSLLVTLPTATAFAQQTPHKVAVLNVSPKKSDGTKVKKALTSALTKQQGVSVTDVADLAKNFPSKKLPYKDLTKLDDAQKTSISKILQDNQLQGIYLVHVTKKGKLLRFVLIAQDATVLFNKTKKLKKRRKINKKIATALAQESSTPLQQHLENRRAAATPKPDPDKTDQNNKTNNGEANNKAANSQANNKNSKNNVAQTNNKPANNTTKDNNTTPPKVIEPGPAPELGVVSLGVLVGQRSYALSTEQQGTLSHNTGLLGSLLRGQVGFQITDAGRLHLDLGAAFAPFSSETKGPNDDSATTHGASFIRADLHARYMHSLMSWLSVGGALGADWVNISIEDNEVYTGQQYLNLRLAAAAQLEPLQGFPLLLQAGVLPALSANTSQEAYGSSDLTLGLELKASIHAQITQNLRAVVHYHYTGIGPSLKDSEYLVGNLETSDTIHYGGVMVGYAF